MNIDYSINSKDYDDNMLFGITIHEYNHKQVIIVIDQLGNQWWDIDCLCEILGLADPEEAFSGLGDDEKMFTTTCEEGIEYTLLLVNEFGVLSLIQQSGSPEAKEFKLWVTYDILPLLYEAHSPEQVHLAGNTLS